MNGGNKMRGSEVYFAQATTRRRQNPAAHRRNYKFCNCQTKRTALTEAQEVANGGKMKEGLVGFTQCYRAATTTKITYQIIVDTSTNTSSGYVHIVQMLWLTKCRRSDSRQCLKVKLWPRDGLWVDIQNIENDSTR